MSRELTQKVIEAGIIPEQSLELLKKWRLIDPSLPSMPDLEKHTRDSLLEFVGQIEELLERETEMPEIRETMPEVTELFRLTGKKCKILCEINSRVEELEVMAVEDAGGCLHIRNDRDWVELFMRPGSQLEWDGGRFEITEVSPGYFGDKIMHYRCMVQGVPTHAEMRKLPEIGSRG